jgi:ABC-2 type transport system ATP-binding protein
MEEAYLLCDEIAIMDRGRIIARGRPDALLAEHFRDVVLELPREDLPAGLMDFPYTVLSKAKVVEILTPDVNAAVSELIARGISLAHLTIRSPNLEDLFLELTGRELRT